MRIAPYTTYGTGNSVLFTFHGYGMDGRQFQVLRESLCVDYQIVGFHLPYHQKGADDHEGWLKSVIETVKQVVAEQGADHFSIAGYSIGVKVVLALLPYFDRQVKDVFLFAPYGLVRHWGIAFLESGFGRGLFRLIAGSMLPIRIINGVRGLGIISYADHDILIRELATMEKRQNLRKTFLLMSELNLDQHRVLKSLSSIRGRVQLVFGKQDNIFPLSGLKGTNELDNLDILEVDEGHWLMTEKLDARLVAFREKILMNEYYSSIKP
ncbi:MAG: hypothetical protein R8G66_13960 [Cytophagales bacterium]|nr:hypothetical protein [Cytophagales bacterium]